MILISEQTERLCVFVTLFKHLKIFIKIHSDYVLKNATSYPNKANTSLIFQSQAFSFMICYEFKYIYHVKSQVIQLVQYNGTQQHFFGITSFVWINKF